MSQRLVFRHLLSPEGILNDCAIDVSTDGRIQAVKTLDTGRETPDYDGWFALPGIANAHSHAFQRAMSGFGERPAGEDSFWSWREHMYRLAARVDPEQMRVIAEQAFAEMLATGFTRVGEFHYVHHLPDGSRSPEMARAVAEAAENVGIGLRLLPVYYRKGGFDSEPGAGQARFVHRDLDGFLKLVESLKDLQPGIAPHSLRAVPPEELGELVRAGRQLLGEDIPFHIHVSEQRREVVDCQARYGRSPVAVLADHVSLDSHWNLVHATHAGPDELRRVAEAGARVVLCPLTEAYLGDGLFAAAEFLDLEGRMAIGSDSNCRIDAVEELRLMEYGQRLRRQQRLLLADSEAGLGAALWRMAAETGGAACGEGSHGGRIEPGARADLVVLDGNSPVFAGHGAETALDALIIGGSRADIAEVHVGGNPMYERVQADAGPRREAFANVVRKIYGETR